MWTYSLAGNHTVSKIKKKEIPGKINVYIVVLFFSPVLIVFAKQHPVHETNCSSRLVRSLFYMKLTVRLTLTDRPSHTILCKRENSMAVVNP